MAGSPDDVVPILHLAADADWAARTATHYAPAAFAAEGFVHCSTAEQLPGVVERYYRGRTDVRLLTIDPARLDAPLLWEDTTGRGEDFPHVYGPIALAAVMADEPFDAS